MITVEAGDSEDVSLGSSWMGHARYIPRYGRRMATPDMWALEIAPVASLGAGIASVQGKERERFSLAGGEVVVADCGDPDDARWAAWMGPWHMAHGMFYAPAWESSDIADVFSRVQWTDTPEGLTADPGDRFDLETAIYLLSVEGVGTLTVESKRAAAHRIPAWRGFSTPAGEIWRLPGEGTESLLCATRSAVATLSPWDVPAAGTSERTGRPAAGTPERAFDFLRGLRRVDWLS